MNISTKGTYIFFARLKRAKAIQYNKKGDVHYFSQGWYAYVGSAFGMGGLRSRLNRHYNGTGNGPWNIDFFRKGVVPCDRAWVSCQEKKLEREWSCAIQFMAGVSVPVANFGNADDRGQPLIPTAGKSHLFHLRLKPEIEVFQAVVDEHFPGNDPVVEMKLPIQGSAKNCRIC